MSEPLSLHCQNCGTPLEWSFADAGSIVCPVCQFVNQVSAAAPLPELTSDTLEAQLELLIGQARSSGLELDEIVRVLSDELEFTAELANSGRNISVQLIDLGPLEDQSTQPPIRDRSVLLRGRAVGK